ncbi:MAG: hypothetical protein ACI92A_001872 [Candidatus Paceibacteria bacterium]|jgi:hypothetical protein
MNFFRLICVLSLSLALGLAPIAAQNARAQTSGLVTLTICSDGGAKTVTLDRDGNPVNPVKAGHACFECCLVAKFLPETLTVPKPHLRKFPVSHATLTQPQPKTDFPCKPRARAPPVLI